jgi:SAM-dependent methyltransferase
MEKIPLTVAQMYTLPQKGHLRHVQDWCPRVLEGKILDIGCASGKFLIEVAKAGGDGIGIEKSGPFIEAAHERAKNAGTTIRVEKGVGEKLPFGDMTFGFVNMSELIEHVRDPEQVLREVRRVLTDDGSVYMSVPNRYGMWDPHFHVFFVNWLPRALAPAFLRVFGRHKDYSKEHEIGFQRLDEMHYFTLRGITKLCRHVGFRVTDNRLQKIKAARMSPMRTAVFLLGYRVARLFYLDTFHLSLTKM